jgi:hypothetical protein
LSSKSHPTRSNAPQLPSRAQHSEAQPPLKLTLEERTPFVRWIILAVFALFACSVLTYLINADNPKITASDLEALAAQPTPTATILANEAGYAAVLVLDPPEQVPTNSRLTLTATLTQHGEPVQGARVHYTIRNLRGVLFDVDGGQTDAGGTSVTEYNIGRSFGHWQTRVIAAFLVDDEVVIRTDKYFTPVD